MAHKVAKVYCIIHYGGRIYNSYQSLKGVTVDEAML